MEILVPVHAKLAAHTTRHVVVRYGLVPTAQEPILNRQRMLLQTNGHAAQRMAQSIYSTVLTHTHKGFSYTYHKDPIPHTFEWTFPEHVM